MFIKALRAFLFSPKNVLDRSRLYITIRRREFSNETFFFWSPYVSSNSFIDHLFQKQRALYVNRYVSVSIAVNREFVSRFLSCPWNFWFAIRFLRLQSLSNRLIWSIDLAQSFFFSLVYFRVSKFRVNTFAIYF